jgi:hypothetical protein
MSASINVGLVITCYDSRRKLQVLLRREGNAVADSGDDQGIAWDLPRKPAIAMTAAQAGAEYFVREFNVPGMPEIDQNAIEDILTLVHSSGLFFLRNHYFQIHIFGRKPPDIEMTDATQFCSWFPVTRLPAFIPLGDRKAIKNSRIIAENRNIPGLRIEDD